MDANVGDGWQAGVATGYMQSNVSVGARSSSADVNSYVLAGYAGGSVGPSRCSSGGAWTGHTIDTSRDVIFPGFFEEEPRATNGEYGQIFAEAAYPMTTYYGAGRARSPVSPTYTQAWTASPKEGRPRH